MVDKSWNPLSGAIIKPTKKKKGDVLIIEDSKEPPKPPEIPKDINKEQAR